MKLNQFYLIQFTSFIYSTYVFLAALHNTMGCNTMKNKPNIFIKQAYPKNDIHAQTQQLVRALHCNRVQQRSTYQ